MQLSQSSVSPDANPFALLFAGSTPTGNCALPTADGSAPGTDFEKLFPDLTPTPAADEAGATELAGAAMVLALTPTLAAPVAEPDLLEGGNAPEDGGSVVSDGETSSAPDLAATRSEGSQGLHLARAVGQTTPREDRGAAVAPGRAAFGEPSKAEEKPTTSGRPSEHAADRAFQTPRFTGLPEAALTHRSAPALPPGLARPPAPEIETSTAIAATANSATTEVGGGEGSVSAVTCPPVGHRGVSEQHASTMGLAKRETSVPAGPLATDVSENETTTVSPTEMAKGNSGVVPAATVSRVQGEAVARFNPHRTPAAVSSDAGEKFADRAAVRAERKDAGRNVAMKSFVTSVKEEFAGSSPSFGTGGAKAMATMFGSTFQSASAPATSDFGMAGLLPVDGVGDIAAAVASGAELPDSVRSAHEAVEVVLHAVEHVASQEQTSVNLKFTVGDSQLSVRVELHANEVRATFRTESDELRSALAQEWQSAASGTLGSDRPTRVVPAFVASSDQAAFNASAGDSFSRQQQPGAQRGEAEAAMAVARRRDPAARATTPAPVASGVYPASSHTSHRLHTLA
jgi:hypothetical protein